MQSFDSLRELWFWPWSLSHTNHHLTQNALATQKAVSACLPSIVAAAKEPGSDGFPEPVRMVGGKAEVLGLSQGRIIAAAKVVFTAGEANAKDFGRLAGGSLLGPEDWLVIGQRNLRAWAALASLPGEVLSPMRRRVASNERRARARSQRNAGAPREP